MYDPDSREKAEWSRARIDDAYRRGVIGRDAYVLSLTIFGVAEYDAKIKADEIRKS